MCPSRPRMTRKRGGEGGDKEKRRTRSDKDYFSSPKEEDGRPTRSHVPVMLAEVVDVFSSSPLRSFVDCTLGTVGHSSAVS